MSVNGNKSDWYLIVRDAGNALRVIARNGHPIDWRPISNVFRGSRLRAAQRLITECLASGASAIGAGFATAVHLAGSNDIRVALMSFQDPDPSGVPEILLWRWEFRRDGVPPVLIMSSAAARAWSLADNAAIRGPADYYSGFANLQDVLVHLRFLYDSPVQTRRHGEFSIEDACGASRFLTSYELIHEVDRRRTITGIAWEPAGIEHDRVLSRSIDAAAWRVLTMDSGQLVVATDMRFDNYPYVVKWMSDRPIGMAKGLSQGVDGLVLHPDDIVRLRQYIRQESDTLVPNQLRQFDGLRVRQIGGGWLRSCARGYRLDSALCPSVWVWVIKPTG